MNPQASFLQWTPIESHGVLRCRLEDLLNKHNNLGEVSGMQRVAKLKLCPCSLLAVCLQSAEKA